MPQLSTIQSVFLVISSTILFIYGLEHFSKEIEAWGAHKLEQILSRWTRYRLGGFLLGAVATGLLQSSSAVSSLTVALVDSQIIRFSQSLAVLIGTNVGTVVTAQLVAFKLTGIGPIFIVLGFVVGLRKSWAISGRSLFYFGFILFALDLISSSLAGLGQSFDMREILLLGQGTWSGLFYGALLTLLVQSSSVTTGLLILLVQQGLLSFESAAPMILGANIGTTSTGLIAAAKLGTNAKKAAVANLLFNVLGVVAFLPFLGVVLTKIRAMELSEAHSVAQVHLWFNLSSAILFLVLLRPFRILVERFFRAKG